MRFRVLVFTLSLILLGPIALQGKKRMAEDHLSLRQKFESEISNLRRNLKQQGLSGRFQTLEESEKDLRQLREKHARQAEGDEVYFDHVLAILDEIPRGPAFELQKCEDYRRWVRAQFTAKEAVKSGLEILNEVCGQ